MKYQRLIKSKAKVSGYFISFYDPLSWGVAILLHAKKTS
jgi:hypothetical protein